VTKFHHLPLCLAGLLLAACGADEPDATAVGTLEIVEVNAGPLQAARAVYVAVDEGDDVRTGDTLVVFALPTTSASEAQAVARANAARQTARAVSATARPAEIARAEAELRAATSESEKAAADLARIEPLAERGDVSRAQLDAARAASRSTASRRDAAQQALRLLLQGATSERRAAARAEADAADAAAALVRASVNDLVLLSPVDGVVTSRNVEPGEVLTPGANAITVGQPSRPYAKIFVSQFVLPSLKVGDTLYAALDRDSTRYVGRVASIATKAEYTPRVALTEKEREDLLFAVRIEFADSTERLKAGLPITVHLPRLSK
jgi:HlyD family secretion protein